MSLNTHQDKKEMDKLKQKKKTVSPVRSWAAACGAQQRADKNEEEGEEDTDGEGTEDVDHHVGVVSLPEDGAEHFSAVVPAKPTASCKRRQHSRQWARVKDMKLGVSLTLAYNIQIQLANIS